MTQESGTSVKNGQAAEQNQPSEAEKTEAEKAQAAHDQKIYDNFATPLIGTFLNLPREPVTIKCPACGVTGQSQVENDPKWWATEINNIVGCLFILQHNQNNSSHGCRNRRPDGAPSPTPSDTSDSDISLGTHSPVPSSLQLHHSPGSTSNGANERDDALSVDDDKPRDLSNALSAASLPSAAMAAAYANSTALPAACLPPFKLDAAQGLFNAAAGCYLQNFSSLKEMSQQFPIQPIVIRPHPQLPQALSLNGGHHHHHHHHHHLHPSYGAPPTAPTAAAAYSNVQAVDCTAGGAAAAAPPPTHPKIRVNSPEKLNSTATSIAASLTTVPAIQETSAYHHSATQLLHRPFSTSPDLPHNGTEIT